MFKRIISLFLTAVLLFSQIPVSVWAEEGEIPEPETVEESTPVGEAPEEIPVEEAEPAAEEVKSFAGASGTCGESMTWTLSADGLLTLAGSGAMATYSSTEPAPWVQYGEYIVELYIPSTVKSISKYAFAECTALETVTIPNAIEVGTNAFYHCFAIRNVTVTGDDYCSLSTDTCLNMPWMASQVGVTVTVAQGVVDIVSHMFENCTALQNVILPVGLSSIGYNSFYGCTNLQSIDIPETVTSINNSAFAGCSSLKRVSVPGGLTYFGSGCFRNCTALEEAIIGEGNSSIPSETFSGCKMLTAVTIPGTVTTIGASAFSNCQALESLPLPDSVSSIGSSAFYNCDALQSVTLPVGVATLGSWAFQNCNGLTEIHFEGDVPQIYTNAFSGVEATAYYPPDNTTWTSSVMTNYGGTITWRPEGWVRPTSGTCGKNVTWQLSDEGALTITGTGAMTDYVSGAQPWVDSLELITEVTVSEGVTRIGNWAFGNAAKLTKVSFAGDAPAIGTDAFCNVTARIFYPAYASGWSTDVQQNYGGTLSWIPLDENGTMVVLPIASGEVGKLTWVLDNLGTLTISGDGEIPDISPYPWMTYKDRITNLVLEEGVTTIKDDAFQDLDITQVSLPESLRTIGYRAFYSCDKLTSVKLPLGLQTIENYAFSGCTGLTGLMIPYTVTQIGYNAFYNCSNLTAVSFGHGAQDSLTLNNPFGGNYVSTVCVPDPDNVHSSITGSFGTDRKYTSITYTAVSLQNVPAIAEVGERVPLQVTMEPAWARPVCFLVIDEEQSTAQADIMEDGTFFAHETGWVTVRAGIHGNSAIYDETQIQITPATAYVSGITLRCDSEIPNEVELGGSVQMTADIQPGNAANKEVTWEVENGTGTATITEDGVLTGLSTGTVTVYATATDGTEIIGSLVVTVNIYADDIGIFIDGREDLFEIGLGQYHMLDYTVLPDTASNNAVVWSVEDGTGSAKLQSSYRTGTYTIMGTSAGTVTLVATAKDSRGLTVRRELTVVGETGTYAVAGGNLYYNTITGAITDCDDTVTVANIPAIINGTQITAIAPYAFANYGSNYHSPNTNKTLTSVTVPSSVTEIGTCAFYECEAMTSLKFSGSSQLKRIGYEAFAYCEALAGSLVIPAGVTDIEKNAFYYCSKLSALTIPDSVENLGLYAFSNLTSLKQLTIPGDLNTNDRVSVGGYVNGVYQDLDTLILTGDRVIGQPYTEYEDEYGTIYFNVQHIYIRNTKNIVLADTVEVIEPLAFDSLDNIVSVTFGSSLEEVGKFAFFDCSGLTQVHLPAAVRSIGDYAFKYCNALTELTFEAGPETIGCEAFSNCYNLEEIVIPQGTRTIADGAFQACNALVSVSLPQGLTTIGEQAFSNCENLEELNLPDTLTTIGKGAFYECDKVQLIDLSQVPDVITQQETPLQPLTQVPPVLVTATGGRTELNWRVSDVDGGYDECDHIASVWGRGVGNETNWVLGVYGTGSIMLHAYDRYTGAHGSKIITIDSGVYIDTGVYPGYLIGGKTLQLTAIALPGNEPASVQWISSDPNVATVSNTGKVTAKAVSQAMQVTITAVPYNGADSASIALWVVPKTTGMDIITEESDVLTGAALDLEMSSETTLTLEAQMDGLDSVSGLTWSSSDPEVAVVDNNGNVTLVGPGTVVITVADIYGTTARVTLHVTFVDTAKKLTATADLPDIGLQPGETATMQVSGEEVIEAEKLTFSSSNEAVALVDENGVITAVGKGTVVITAVLTGDPLNRKAELKLTVIPTQTETVLLRPVGDFRELILLDEDGNVTEDDSAAVKYVVYLDQADVRQGLYTTFTIWPTSWDSQGNVMESPTFKWASSNTKMAAVKANANGGATVTVKNTASGAWVITAMSADLAKVEQEVEIHVRDFAPRLETTAFTVNSYLEDPFVSTTLSESYGNSIVSAEVLDDKGEPCYAMSWGVDQGQFTIGPSGFLSNGIRKLTLRLTCADGKVYDYALKVTVKNTAPAVTVKQAAKLNLFYTDSESMLTVTAKNGVVQNVELEDTEDFVLEYDAETGTAALKLSESYDPAVKPDTKATLAVYLEGYSTAVTKAITIGTVTTAPKLTMTPASSTVNTWMGEQETSFAILCGGSVLPLNQEDVTVTAPFGMDYDVEDDRIVIRLTEGEGGTAAVLVQQETWTKPVKLSHRIKRADTMPTAKADGKLALNRVFYWQEAAVGMSLSQSNLEFGWFDEFVSTSAEGEKIWVDYDGENLIAGMIDPEDLPRNGTYTFTTTPYLADGTALAPMKVQVSVTATAPRVKANSSTLKLNQLLSGYEIASTGFTVTGGVYTLAGFAELDDFDDPDLNLTFVDGSLVAELVNDEAAVKRTTLSLTPILEDEYGNQALLETKVKITVQVYKNDRITVTLSSKGKLDAAVPESAIAYTVTKISNALDTIEEDDVILVGPDADLFDLEFNEAGQILLKLRPNGIYATNRTYKVQLEFLICGREVLSKVLSFKVTQSTLKVSVPKTVVYFQSQATPLRAVITLTSPEGAALDPERIAINEQKSAAFLKALGGKAELTVKVSEDGRSAEVLLPITSPGRLTVGKSYTLVLDVFSEHCAENLMEKPVQVKLTVKISQ